MTFAEFEQLPDSRDASYELRHGEAVKVPPPEYDHFLIQQMLRDLLDRAAAGRGRAYTGVAFRALADGEYRVADVAYAPAERWTKHKGERYFMGAPDLVIEVPSPSNTFAEMLDKKILCLANGAASSGWLTSGIVRSTSRPRMAIRSLTRTARRFRCSLAAASRSTRSFPERSAVGGHRKTVLNPQLHSLPTQLNGNLGIRSTNRLFREQQIPHCVRDDPWWRANVGLTLPDFARRAV
jgi:hypothetical protein